MTPSRLPTITPTAALSQPSLFLRIEALALFIAAIAAYASQGFSGLAFIALLLVPDVAMVGYFVNPRLGALGYNLGHLYVWPLLLIALGLTTSAPLALQLGLIWAAHISMDRVVGYGFKYPSAFKESHMQRV